MKNKSKKAAKTRKPKKKDAKGVSVDFNMLFVLLACFFAVLGVIFGLIKQSTPPPPNSVDIYFFDPADSTLAAEVRPMEIININDEKERRKKTIAFVLEELSIGPKNVPLEASVPPDLIKAATISGTNVDVMVSEKYGELKPKEELICRSAVAYTLTSLDFVESVTINVDGEELKKPNGSPFGQMKLEDIVLSPDMTHQGEMPKTFLLYFANKEQTKLVSERRTVLANSNEPVAKYIVEELIKGPNLSDLSKTVPAETVLRDISTSDGICYVDLSKEFITRHPESMSAELSVYSIVNSLTEQSDIKNVQFYIEGERLEKFKTINDFSNLFGAKSLPIDESE